MGAHDQPKKRRLGGDLSRLERNWVSYDVGNSAFTLLVTTILPIYFKSVAAAAGVSEAHYLAYWGYAASVTTIVVAVLGPILGALSDRSRSKKQFFIGSVAIGILAMLGLILPLSWFSFLIFYVVSKCGYQASLVFYDAMLPDVSSDERMDKVSSYGFALGYIMSCIPFALSLLFILFGPSIGLSLRFGMSAAIVINAAWWLIFTLPLLRTYQQRYYVERGKGEHAHVFRGLARSIRAIARNRKVFLFLLAFFFYIDGVYTIIDMAVAYGTSIGLGEQALLLALLVTQIVAFPATLAFSRLAKKYPNHQLIRICIIAYTLIAAFAVQLDKAWEFWLLAVCVGLFQGGVQALSRSYYAQLIPKEESGGYFGIYDIFGKGAAFTGTTLVAVITHASGRQSYGIAAIVVIFMIGYLLFALSLRKR